MAPGIKLSRLCRQLTLSHQFDKLQKHGASNDIAATRRYEPNEKQWNKIKDLLPGRAATVGVTAKDNRRFVNGVTWVFG